MHATASGWGADGTTEFHTGEERDLRSLKKMLLGAVAFELFVAARKPESFQVKVGQKVVA